MFDVVCVGNATIDAFICMKGRVRERHLMLPVGSKKEVQSIFYSTGGGATNTAVGFSRLGLRAGVLAAIGNDAAGGIVIRELRKEGIGTGLVSSLQNYSTAYSAILTGFGADRIILVYGGATTHLGEERHIRWSLLSQTRWMHVSSFHAEPRILHKVLEFGKARHIGISFNPGKSEIALGMKRIAPMLRLVDVLLLNREEAGILTKEKSLKGQMRKLQVLAPIVVVTEGRKGSNAFDGSFFYHKPSYNVKIADTTGAGDAFHSGFVAAIIRGKPIERALDEGNANAESVIMHLGAKNKLLTQGELERFIAQHETSRTKVEKETA